MSEAQVYIQSLRERRLCIFINKKTQFQTRPMPSWLLFITIFQQYTSSLIVKFVPPSKRRKKNTDEIVWK